MEFKSMAQKRRVKELLKNEPLETLRKMKEKAVENERDAMVEVLEELIKEKDLSSNGELMAFFGGKT